MHLIISVLYFTASKALQPLLLERYIPSNKCATNHKSVIHDMLSDGSMETCLKHTDGDIDIVYSNATSLQIDGKNLAASHSIQAYIGSDTKSLMQCDEETVTSEKLILACPMQLQYKVLAVFMKFSEKPDMEVCEIKPYYG